MLLLCCTISGCTASLGTAILTPACRLTLTSDPKVCLRTLQDEEPAKKGWEKTLLCNKNLAGPTWNFWQQPLAVGACHRNSDLFFFHPPSSSGETHVKPNTNLTNLRYQPSTLELVTFPGQMGAQEPALDTATKFSAPKKVFGTCFLYETKAQTFSMIKLQLMKPQSWKKNESQEVECQQSNKKKMTDENQLVLEQSATMMRLSVA